MKQSFPGRLLHVMLDLLAFWRPQHLGADVNDSARRVSLQQIRRLIEGSQGLAWILTMAIDAGIFLWMLALCLVCSPTFAATWGTVALIWQVARMQLSRRFRETAPAEEAFGRWEAFLRWLDTSRGCVWGAVGLLVPQEVPAHAPYVALGELLVIGLALNASVIHRPAIVWFLVPCSALTALGLLLAGGLLNTCVALGFVIAVALLVDRAFAIQGLIRQFMLAAEERQMLLRELEAQRSAAVADHEDRTRFLASVSKDLDAPMQLIERLNQGLSGEDTAALGRMRQMNAAVLEMDRLLMTLLDESVHRLGRRAPQPAAASAACTHEDARRLHGQLVLLVDDEPSALGSMRTLLQGLGCTVVCAESAEVALQIVDEQLRTPDLIVSDYHLGGSGTGLEAIEAARERIGEAIPAWLISADLDLPIEHARSRGVQVLSKPVCGDVLAAEMARAVAGVDRGPGPTDSYLGVIDAGGSPD